MVPEKKDQTTDPSKAPVAKKSPAKEKPDKEPKGVKLADVEPSTNFTLDGELHRLVHFAEGLAHVMRLKKTLVKKSEDVAEEQYVGVERKDLPTNTIVTPVK